MRISKTAAQTMRHLPKSQVQASTTRTTEPDPPDATRTTPNDRPHRCHDTNQARQQIRNCARRSLHKIRQHLRHHRHGSHHHRRQTHTPHDAIRHRRITALGPRYTATKPSPRICVRRARHTTITNNSIPSRVRRDLGALRPNNEINTPTWSTKSATTGTTTSTQSHTNTSKHATTGFTPFELQFSRQPILPLDLVLDSETRHPQSRRESRQFDTTEINGDDIETITLRDAFNLYNEKLSEIEKQYHDQLIKTMKQAFEAASKHRDYQMSKAKLIYDRKAQPDAFGKDDLFLALHPAIISGQTRGLAKNAHGPFRVLDRVGPVDYLIQLASNSNS